jgi:hypothetical protein
VNNEWTLQDAQAKETQLIDFLTYTEYTKSPGNYSAQSDPKSPFNFAPPHCYQPDQDYNMPLVAVVKTGGRLEDRMI